MNCLRSFLAGLAVLAAPTVMAQAGVGNHGNLRLHNQGSVGVHGNFFNTGSYNSPDGLTGFYRDKGSIRIWGASKPDLYDVEFSAAGGIWLELPMEIANNANLVQGDVRTPWLASEAQPIFAFDSFYTGESNASKVVGFAGIQNKSRFTFPVGREDHLRPLTLESEAVNAGARCAYFFENPQSAGTLGRAFEAGGPQAKGPLSVSDKEFWKLEASIPSRVTLTWDVRSSVPSLSQFLDELRVVGWNKETQSWEDLGNTQVSGGRDHGSITSATFLPDRYEILTLGGSGAASESYEIVNLDNYYLSPNGDGVNENLEIAMTRDNPNNSIQIYDRNGLLVYQKDRYLGEFNGISNVDLAVNRRKGLEAGIYFYLITFHDLRQRHQGYFYLTD